MRTEHDAAEPEWLDEVNLAESTVSTAWWWRDAADRAAEGELPGEGEAGQGLDESEFRTRYAYLLRG